MNVLRRFAVFVHASALELLLVLAVVLLVGQLGWPSAMRWWCLPSPGTIGVDQFEADTLAPNYVIYLPQSYREKQPWPLVVFLHGSGQRGDDPRMLRERGPLPLQLPAIVVAPQCLPSSSWQPDAVAAFVEQVASRYHVDRRRIYLVGYSMGGYGAWHTAATYPDLFSAIVPIASSGEPNNAQAVANVSVWAFHGAKDEAIPSTESERMVEATRAAGGQPRLTILPDAAHGICEDVCERADLWEWLFKQSK